MTLSLLVHSVKCELGLQPEQLEQQCNGNHVACSDATMITLSLIGHACANLGYVFSLHSL